ncbi:hypothetical protein ARMSODRAFT_1026628 [Armillaria solidipes]|uniref:S-Me-THD-like C-terminal domain-containing protein n=1 Tax=Armillaria solidipes TaxID=1076256 RepID=A0A2H3BBB9_9AGAR|nr:hypothetical protein ARMSODRAFT_1026628 [Armillaria solidipes]
MGSSAALVPAPMTVAETRDYGVRRTLSQAWGIGQAIAICRQKNDLKSVLDEILKLQNGKLLFIGKIVDVSQEVRAGFTREEVKIKRLGEDEPEDSSTSTLNMDHGPDDHMIIPFQNENLVAYIEKPDDACSTPRAAPTWAHRCILMGCGPAAFRFDHRYFPVGEYKTTLSVIEEYKR